MSDALLKADLPLTIVVGPGGVGKTTLAAALALRAAEAGHRTLVMTFDPSLRLKDALGVGEEARERAVPVNAGTRAELEASLLDARRTFDRLIERYAPDDEARERILSNRYYDQFTGSLAGILEYMAVERLFEVAHEGGYDRIVLDTPPTRQAIDFLEAPERILAFLDSGALRIATREWFDERGRVKNAGPIKRAMAAFLDRIVGLGLLRDMVEFFTAFQPLYDGFRERAVQVQALLRAETTGFVLVSGPGEERIPDTMYFARKLGEADLRLGRVFVNRVHTTPEDQAAGDPDDPAWQLWDWLVERDRHGVDELRHRLGATPLDVIPLEAKPPADLDRLRRLAGTIDASLR